MREMKRSDSSYHASCITHHGVDFQGSPPTAFSELSKQLKQLMDRREFYEAQKDTRIRSSRRHYHRLLRNYFAFLVPPQLRVLELGCATGDLLASVQPTRGVGVDFSPAIIDEAKKRHPQLEFAVAEATEFQTDEKFDYILL